MAQETSEVKSGSVVETPDGPMLAVEVLEPFGKRYALLTPYNPMWVELDGDEVKPVAEKDIALLNALLGHAE